MSKFDENLLGSLLTLKTSPKGSMTGAINRLSVDLSLSPRTLQRALKGQISDRTRERLLDAYSELDAREKARASQAFSHLDAKSGRQKRIDTIKQSFKDPLGWGRKLQREREKFDKKRAKAEKKGDSFALKNLSIIGAIS